MEKIATSSNTQKKVLSVGAFGQNKKMDSFRFKVQGNELICRISWNVRIMNIFPGVFFGPLLGLVLIYHHNDILEMVGGVGASCLGWWALFAGFFDRANVIFKLRSRDVLRSNFWGKRRRILRGKEIAELKIKTVQRSWGLSYRNAILFAKLKNRTTYPLIESNDGIYMMMLLERLNQK